MKRIAWVVVTLLCSAMLLFAGDKGKAHDMTGWVCNDKCVSQTAGKATCDASCTDTSGDYVFIDDKGKVDKIANQDMAKPMSGKKVKMKATMDKDTHMLTITEFASPLPPG